MVGSALALAAKELDGREFLGFGHEGLDILQVDRLRAAFERHRPQFLINCAAYRDVDKAEVEPGLAFQINAEGPRLLAEACKEFGVKLVHFSTHGVFDGKKAGPYVESDPALPINRYAGTKLEGEAAIARLLPPDQYLILRISWPYGTGANNFIGAILEAAKTRDEVRVVADQVGSPTPLSLIARQTLALISGGRGRFHLTCRGSCSRFELMESIFKRLGLGCKITPVMASDFPTLAPRPANIALATELKWMEEIAPMPTWREGLDEWLRKGLV